MWDAVVNVHLKGTFCVTQPVFRWMKDHKRAGVIVNTSSSSGLGGSFGQTNYGAAKAGIWGFSNCLALEGAKYGIRVWTLCPAAATSMTAALMTPEMIEKMVGRARRAGGAVHGQQPVGQQDEQDAVRVGQQGDGAEDDGVGRHARTASDVTRARHRRGGGPAVPARVRHADRLQRLTRRRTRCARSRSRSMPTASR